MQIVRRLYGILGGLLCSSFLLFAGTGEAGINLPWSTSFNCGTWMQSVGSASFNCDNMSLAGYGYSCNHTGAVSVINTAGNNPLGTGSGFRKAVGDGVNISAAKPMVYFNAPQREFWMRWYQKFPSALSGMSGIKLIYYNLVGQENAGYVALHSGDIDLYSQAGGTRSGISHYNNHANCDKNSALSLQNRGAYFIWGGSNGDNEWHSYEMHFKISSSPNAVDGVFEAWVDGVLFTRHYDIDLFAPFNSIGININHGLTTNPGGQCVYIDIDDIVISSQGYIGPIGEAGSVLAKPSPPLNVR